MGRGSEGRPDDLLEASIGLLGVGAGTLLGQAAVPDSQPGVLTIYIEQVKIGMDAAHAANEAGWPGAYAKSGSPDTYLALASMTGTSQVWYTSGYDSYAQEGEAIARDAADPVLSAELALLATNDGQFLESFRVVQARARPDLGHGDFPNLALARFWDISTFRIRPGHDAQFEEAAKVYGAAAARLAPGTSFRVYTGDGRHARRDVHRLQLGRGVWRLR